MSFRTRLGGALLLSGAALALSCGRDRGGGEATLCRAESIAGCEYTSQGLSFSERDDLMATDDLTGRELPLLVRIPEGAGPFPLVVWSHGGGFKANGHHLSTRWGEAFARHGYAVLHIAHIPLTTEAGTALCEHGGVPPAECTPDGDEDTTGLIAMVKTRDVIAVLDALPAIADEMVAAGDAAVDLDRVAIAGWSAGSRAPLITHGAVFLPSPSAAPLSMPHALPKAAIALSPIGPGYAGFFDTGTENTWQGTRGPIFVATGDNDVKPTKPDLTGADRRIAFEKQPADGSRWLLYSGLSPGVGGHSTFNLDDLGSSDERVARFSRALRSSALAFLDATLNDDAAATEWLATTNASVLAGDAEWVHK